eukprot:scaffold7095_cov260-Pinguiococcus_pyrenoidosus.AAC.6
MSGWAERASLYYACRTTVSLSCDPQNSSKHGRVPPQRLFAFEQMHYSEDVFRAVESKSLLAEVVAKDAIRKRIP